MSFDQIAEETDSKIQQEAGKPLERYIEGLETVIDYLQTNLNAARED